MAIIRSLLLISLSTVLITACDSSINTPDDAGEDVVIEDPAEATDNPCLTQGIIQGIKSHIVGNAIDNIETNYNSDTIDTSIIYLTDIGFSYISQATKIENGGWSCSAQVDVTYIGDADSDGDLAPAIAQMMNADYLTLSNLGITPYNIDEFRELKGNSFSIPIEYQIRTTYSESGEAQQSYEALISRVSDMLAAIAVTDDRVKISRALDAKYEKQALGQQESEAPPTQAYEEQEPEELGHSYPIGSAKSDSYKEQFMEQEDEVVVAEEPEY